MRNLAVILTLLLAAAPVAGGPSAPTSRPAKPAGDVTLTPLGWMRAYNTAMLNGDKDDLLARTHATGADAKKLAQAVTGHDAVVGKLLKLAKDKLDAKSAHLIGQTLGDIGNDDLADATVTIDGDKAIVSVGGGISDTHLVLHDGQWKLDFDHSADQQARVGVSMEARLTYLKTRTDAARSLLAAIEAGQIKTVDDALFILRREMSE